MQKKFGRYKLARFRNIDYNLTVNKRDCLQFFVTNQQANFHMEGVGEANILENRR